MLRVAHDTSKLLTLGKADEAWQIVNVYRMTFPWQMTMSYSLHSSSSHASTHASTHASGLRLALAAAGVGPCTPSQTAPRH